MCTHTSSLDFVACYDARMSVSVCLCVWCYVLDEIGGPDECACAVQMHRSVLSCAAHAPGRLATYRATAAAAAAAHMALVCRRRGARARLQHPVVIRVCISPCAHLQPDEPVHERARRLHRNRHAYDQRASGYALFANRTRAPIRICICPKRIRICIRPKRIRVRNRTRAPIRICICPKRIRVRKSTSARPRAPV